MTGFRISAMGMDQETDKKKRAATNRTVGICIVYYIPSIHNYLYTG